MTSDREAGPAKRSGTVDSAGSIELPRFALTEDACMERAQLAWRAAALHYRRWLLSRGVDRESYNWWQHYEGIYAYECRLADICQINRSQRDTRP